MSAHAAWADTTWTTFETHLHRIFETSVYDDINALRTRLRLAVYSDVFESKWAQMISDALFVLALGRKRCCGPAAIPQGRERLARCLHALIASRPCHLCFLPPNAADAADATDAADAASDDEAMVESRYQRGDRPKIMTAADATAPPEQKGTPWSAEQVRKLYIDLEVWATEGRFQTMDRTYFRSNVRPSLNRALYNPNPYPGQRQYWFMAAFGSFPDQGAVLKGSGKKAWHASGIGSPYWFSSFWGFLSKEDAFVSTDAGVVRARSLLPTVSVTNGYAVADLKLLGEGIDGYAYGRKLIMAMRLLYEYMEFHVLSRIRRQGKGWADILDDEDFVRHLRDVAEPEPPTSRKGQKRAREEE